MIKKNEWMIETNRSKKRKEKELMTDLRLELDLPKLEENKVAR